MFIQLLYLLFILEKSGGNLGISLTSEQKRKEVAIKKHTEQTKSSLCLHPHLVNDFQANSSLMRAQQFFFLCVWHHFRVKFMVQTNNFN